MGTTIELKPDNAPTEAGTYMCVRNRGGQPELVRIVDYIDEGRLYYIGNPTVIPFDHIRDSISLWSDMIEISTGDNDG